MHVIIACVRPGGPNLFADVVRARIRLNLLPLCQEKAYSVVRIRLRPKM